MVREQVDTSCLLGFESFFPGGSAFPVMMGLSTFIASDVLIGPSISFANLVMFASSTNEVKVIDVNITGSEAWISSAVAWYR